MTAPFKIVDTELGPVVVGEPTDLRVQRWKAGVCMACGQPCEPYAYCREHRVQVTGATIDINALDPLDPVHSNNARLAEHGEDIDAQGDPDWSTNPGLYAISAATKGAT